MLSNYGPKFGPGVGSGGGTSGRTMALCLRREDLNPRMDLGFFQFRIAVNLFLQCVGLFLIMSNIMQSLKL